MGDEDGKVMMGYKVPSEQKITIKIVPNEGGLVNAIVFGGMVRSAGRLLKACCDNDSDIKFEVFMCGLRILDDGTIEFEMAILPENKGNP